MSDIGVDRPEQVALLTAIEDAIEGIALGKMTAIEVMGVLEQAKLTVYQDNVLLPILSE